MTSLLIVMYLMMLTAWITCLRVHSHAWRLRDVLLASITLGLVTEVAAMISMHLMRSNSVVYNLCVPLEFLLVLWLIHRFRPHWRTVLVVAAVVGCLGMLTAGSIQDPTVFLLVEGVLVLSAIMAILLLAALWSLASTSQQPLQKVPEFWLFMGLLVYFGGMVPYIGMIRFVFRQDAGLAEKLALIMPLLCIGRYAFIAGACVMQERRTRSLLHE